ncbi:MAG: nuclear transport factor 2 family protein [Ilumatobacteraceae bacterium]
MGDVDYGALFDEHMADEFVLRDVDATMTTMTDDPVVLHVPTSIGGRGVEGVRDFYAGHFIGTFPDDFAPTPLSRTVGADRLVDEMTISFTHTCEVPIFLPGIAPTGRQLRFPLVAVVGFTDGKVASEHLYWDQATVLVAARRWLTARAWCGASDGARDRASRQPTARRRPQPAAAGRG